MKKIFCLLISLLALTACEKANLVDDEESPDVKPTGKTYKVNVMTRAATSSADIIYPIRVQAADNAGTVVAQQQLSSASDELMLTLPTGNYTITAVSGSTEFKNGYSDTPLLIGHSDVTISNANANVNIIMSYAVASIDFVLLNVPTTVTDVSVTLSQLYTSVSPLGVYGAAGSVTIPCTRGSNGQWTTAQRYVLPGASTTTVMSMTLKTPSGSEIYSVTYQSPLKAATPYHFAGTYTGTTTTDFSVTGSLHYEGWGSDVSGDFSFGPSADHEFGDAPAEATEVEVASLPSMGGVWDGHVVAYIEGNDALLISTQEWANLTSALYEDDPLVAKNIKNAYVEGRLSGWTIPTTEQARLLKTQWNSATYAELNSSLQAVGGAPIMTNINDKAVRYLCNDARSTFSFASNSSIIAAGTKVDTYRLRLVKTVHFKVK